MIMRKAQLCGPNLRHLQGCSRQLQLTPTHTQIALAAFYMGYMH